LDPKYACDNTHPTGDLSNNISNDKDFLKPLICDTYGGQVHVEWDPETPITPIGQLVFFVQFLKTCELFKNWVDDCPLDLTSPNASKKVDILGTMLLAVLSGQYRYAHISGIRNDTVNPELLGMNKVLSEDSVRRAFQHADQVKCEAWQQTHLKKCYNLLLDEKWILDVDTTVKVLYGHQEGAEVGYNPQKPGRPAHIIHTYMMAETRLILDSEVLPGKQTPSSYSLPRLLELIDEQPKEKQPSLVRGDCAFGNELVLGELEKRAVPYLFKIRQTKKARELIDLCNRKESLWVDAGQDWEGTEAELQLSTWPKKRRVIVLRRYIEKEKRPGRKKKNLAQLLLPFMNEVQDSSEYEYAILVTSLNEEVLAIAQLYRDRATCENTFDELKNQWGWAGFVTKDLKRSQIMARVVTQVYNWWTLYTRWIDPEKHREAITSRPLMLYAVAKKIRHAGQTTLKVSPLHAKSEGVKKRIGLISRFLKAIKRYAEQFDPKTIFRIILSSIFVKYLKGRILGKPYSNENMSHSKGLTEETMRGKLVYG
jgi:hypothetical protein